MSWVYRGHSDYQAELESPAVQAPVQNVEWPVLPADPPPSIHMTPSGNKMNARKDMVMVHTIQTKYANSVN